MAAEDEVAEPGQRITAQHRMLGDTTDRLGEPGAHSGSADDAGDGDGTARAYQPHTRSHRALLWRLELCDDLVGDIADCR
ncbi:hypothetical protein GCM10010532_106100 [Dactylosporangium siamense]|uniref:Uncharacterized protein n=1 Tax=Dactylosporangium siamense TaxID=685454 RepID=A0A919PXU8_9ACTN|nr:hypothetical protein Dsi01nite_101350 [Dactylosporangium siamense]